MSWAIALALLVGNPNASDIKIVMECPLQSEDGGQHKILLGFSQEYISKVDPRSATVLDPDKILGGMPARSINIDETMRAGTKYAVTFGGERDAFKLKLKAVEMAAFEATLTSENTKNGPSYSGRCFMIDGPIATYVFERRQRGEWGTK